MIPVMDRFTHSRVVSADCWFFVNISVSTFIMARASLLLTHSCSSSHTGGGGGGGGGGCTYFGGMVNRKQKATQLVIG
jgi:uncharacterized membrane protein